MKIPNPAFLSATLRYDLAAHVVVFERLNPDTGEVAFQVPSPAALKEEERAAAIAADKSAAVSEVSSTPKADASTIHPPADPPQSATSGSPRISFLV